MLKSRPVNAGLSTAVRDRWFGPQALARSALGRSLSISLLLLPLLLFAGSDSFRFAWLSDTHVGSANADEYLRAAVSDINSMTGLSFVLVAGDVTEYGSREQLRLAKEIMNGLTIPCHVIPGNHDTKWSASGGTDFGRFWGQDRFAFDGGGFRFIGLHEGPLMKMGDGHWAPQDVRWLEKTLRHLKYRNQPIIFVTHYPIDDGIANWYAVLDLLKRYNTQVVLCGHGHSNRKLLFEGLPGVMGRSSLGTAKVQPGFNLVEVKDGRMTFCERITGRETRTAWLHVTLGKANYAKSRRDWPRPDFSINDRYPQVKEHWTCETGYTIAGSPALWNKCVIVADTSGTIRALSLKNGKSLWHFKTGHAVCSTPAIAQDLVVCPSTDGNIYALRAANGKLVWRVSTPRPIVASPAISDETV